MNERRVREVVEANLPGYRVESVSVLGEGQQNVAFDVNGELVVRFSKEPDHGRRVEREAGLLGLVAEVSPLPVPVVRFVSMGQGCLAYSKLPGVPMSEVSLADAQARAADIGSPVGGLLRALHDVPIERVRELVDVDADPLQQWLDEAEELYRRVRDRVPDDVRPAIDAFFRTPPPPEFDRIVFSHNDLGIEHLLVDSATWDITGVIDWADAAIDDPAYDFGLLYRDLGPRGLGEALASYGEPGSEELRERAAFYARCSVIEDLAYGLDSGRGWFVDKGDAAMTWLFPSRE